MLSNRPLVLMLKEDNNASPAKLKYTISVEQHIGYYNQKRPNLDKRQHKRFVWIEGLLEKNFRIIYYSTILM